LEKLFFIDTHLLQVFYALCFFQQLLFFFLLCRLGSVEGGLEGK
jgi:hypothetical protein